MGRGRFSQSWNSKWKHVGSPTKKIPHEGAPGLGSWAVTHLLLACLSEYRENGYPQNQSLTPGTAQTWESLTTSTLPALLFQRGPSGTFQPKLPKTEIRKTFKRQYTNVPICAHSRSLWDGMCHCRILPEKKTETHWVRRLSRVTTRDKVQIKA